MRLCRFLCLGTWFGSIALGCGGCLGPLYDCLEIFHKYPIGVENEDGEVVSNFCAVAVSNYGGVGCCKRPFVRECYNGKEKPSSFSGGNDKFWHEATLSWKKEASPDWEVVFFARGYIPLVRRTGSLYDRMMIEDVDVGGFVMDNQDGRVGIYDDENQRGIPLIKFTIDLQSMSANDARELKSLLGRHVDASSRFLIFRKISGRDCAIVYALDGRFVLTAVQRMSGPQRIGKDEIRQKYLWLPCPSPKETSDGQGFPRAGTPSKTRLN